MAADVVERERTILGQTALLDGTDPAGPWVLKDGSRWWFCAGEFCTGLQWKASNVPHPTTCARPPAGEKA